MGIDLNAGSTAMTLSRAQASSISVAAAGAAAAPVGGLMPLDHLSSREILGAVAMTPGARAPRRQARLRTRVVLEVLVKCGHPRSCIRPDRPIILRRLPAKPLPKRAPTVACEASLSLHQTVRSFQGSAFSSNDHSGRMSSPRDLRHSKAPKKLRVWQ